jgi:plasmid stabilization system protein ParE
MRKFDLLYRAQLDIVELAEYASDYSDAARDRITDRLFDCFEFLSEFPRAGRERLELATNLRSYPVPQLRVVVYYALQANDAVLVVRVLRHERDVTARDFA